jgi:hypothetical protein
MVGNRYRVSKPTVGVRESCNGRVLHTLRLGSIVSVNSLSEDGRSVHVDSAGVNLTPYGPEKQMLPIQAAAR